MAYYSFNMLMHCDKVPICDTDLEYSTTITSNYCTHDDGSLLALLLLLLLLCVYAHSSL